MTEAKLNRILKNSHIENGVNIVMMPFSPKVTVLAAVAEWEDGRERFIFINSNRSKDKRPELIKVGFQKLNRLEASNDQ